MNKSVTFHNIFACICQNAKPSQGQSQGHFPSTKSLYYGIHYAYDGDFVVAHKWTSELAILYTYLPQFITPHVKHSQGFVLVLHTEKWNVLSNILQPKQVWITLSASTKMSSISSLTIKFFTCRSCLERYRNLWTSVIMLCLMCDKGCWSTMHARRKHTLRSGYQEKLLAQKHIVINGYAPWQVSQGARATCIFIIFN